MGRKYPYKGNVVPHGQIRRHIVMELAATSIWCGPCYLKLSTYFPFYAEFYFNAHNMLVLAMERRGLAYRKDGNALTMIENEKEVQKIVWSLSGKQVRDRIRYWMRRFFRFETG